MSVPEAGYVTPLAVSAGQVANAQVRGHGVLLTLLPVGARRGTLWTPHLG